MAGVQWSGGKCHGAGEAKALLRHNDRDQRLKYEHSNPDLDTSLTHLNFSYFDKTYFQKALDYDHMMEAVKCKRKSSGKNATVTMQDLVIYCPAEMMDEKTGEYDYDRVCQWFRDVGKLMEDRYGPCFIDMDVHFDEVHMYIEPLSQKYTWSRVHAHVALIPAVPSYASDDPPAEEYVLNAKKFSSREAILATNNLIHEMTMDRYGMAYLKGKKKKVSDSVEHMKAISAKALDEREEKIKKREEDLKRREEEYQELIILGRRVKAEQLSDGITKKKPDHDSTARRLPNINY